MPRRANVWLAAAPLLALAACGDEPGEPEAEATELPEEFQGSARSAEESAADAAAAEELGTPMAERLVTIGLVNKRNNISRDIEMFPGETRRIDDVIVRVEACERTAPWEELRQTGAFVQVFVNERTEAGGDTSWNGVFSGWLYKESPSLNVVEHPIYDVWLKECAMSFPGEEEAVSDTDSDA